MQNETSLWPVAAYLRDERYGLRAPSLDDAEHAGAWHEGRFPIPPDTARELLIDQETIPWGANPVIRLIVVELETHEVIGGVLVKRDDNRVSELKITIGGARRAGEPRQHISAAILRLVVPWVMQELDLMTTRVDVPADEAILIDAARQLGMTEAVRLREHVSRPDGRVDLLMMELVNREWGRCAPGGDDHA